MTNTTRSGEEHLTTADFARSPEPVERKDADGRADSTSTMRGERVEPSTMRSDSGSVRTDTASGRAEGLFPGTESQGFQGRWSDIQTSFVDEPRRAVEQADGLVAEVMQRLAQVFSDERAKLEQQWDRGEDTDTEALRQAFRRYRSFFDRLLSV